MCFSIIRFWFKGWIETLYIEPSFHFSYYGFEWVKPIDHYTYVLFIICGISAFLVAVGLKYRLSIFLFFLSFTYIELMDKTTYLNHYYLISILSFLMIFLPANASFSIDNLIKKRSYLQVPKWTIDSIKVLLTIVYFYSGLAKINSDWLFKAMPLKIWLPSKFDLPLIGENLMQLEWVHYLMSWGGMFYDLLIPFLLLYKPTRIYAFLLVIFFHLFTKVLFPIGMFPYIMIMGSLIFFDSSWDKSTKFALEIHALSDGTSFVLIRFDLILSSSITSTSAFTNSGSQPNSTRRMCDLQFSVPDFFTNAYGSLASGS